MSKRRPRKNAKKKVLYYSPKRRAVYAAGDDIDHLILFGLHGWTCGVCLEQINPRLRFPNYRAATVEHIIPISKGGTHTWDNVVPAHAECNFKKSDALPDEFSSVMVA